MNLTRLQVNRVTLLHFSATSTLLYLSSLSTIATSTAFTQSAFTYNPSKLFLLRHIIVTTAFSPIAVQKIPTRQRQPLTLNSLESQRIPSPLSCTHCSNIIMPTTRSGRVYFNSNSNSNSNLSKAPKPPQQVPSQSTLPCPSLSEKVHHVSPSPPKQSKSKDTRSLPVITKNGDMENEHLVTGMTGGVKVEQKARYDFSIFAHRGDDDVNTSTNLNVNTSTNSNVNDNANAAENVTSENTNNGNNDSIKNEESIIKKRRRTKTITQPNSTSKTRKSLRIQDTTNTTTNTNIAPNSTTDKTSTPTTPKSKTKTTKRKRTKKETPKNTQSTTTKSKSKTTKTPPSSKRRKRIEVGSLPPPTNNWLSTYNLVVELRADKTAPLDYDGGHALPEKHRGDVIYRYQVLTALMLSSQTKDAVVGDAMRALQGYKRSDNGKTGDDSDSNGDGDGDGLTVDNVHSMDIEVLKSFIGKVGFYNNKSKYMKQTAEMLIRDYDGDIPSTAEEMMKLPGVGPKMVRCVYMKGLGENYYVDISTSVHLY